MISLIIFMIIIDQEHIIISSSINALHVFINSFNYRTFFNLKFRKLAVNETDAG